MKKLILILSVLSITLSSCLKKSYEKGPIFSLRTKKARLANKWRVEEVFDRMDGASIPLTEEQKNGYVEFTSDNQFTQTTTPSERKGTWDFYITKSSIAVTYDYTDSFGYQYSYEEYWDIIKLKKKELWIINASGNEIHYVPY